MLRSRELRWLAFAVLLPGLGLVQRAFGEDSVGVLQVHEIRSPRQRTPTKVSVLVPRRKKDSERWPVIYVLPVERQGVSVWGDPIAEVRNRKLLERYDVIWAFPTFSDLPWYADHPEKQTLQQEAYFLKDVAPLVEAHYRPRSGRAGRLLLGFSKSGWGAWSLLLRNPAMFERAAAWDAPMMTARTGKYGSGPIFGSQENFERYQITRLLESTRNKPLDSSRLILVDKGNFRKEHAAVHRWMTERELGHTLVDGPIRKHHWNSGWLEFAVEALVKPVERNAGESVRRDNCLGLRRPAPR